MPISTEALGGGILAVRIVNPRKRNALDLEMFSSLAQLWPRLARASDVRCVLVAGGDPSAFCAGADLSADLDCLPGIDDLIDRALLKTSFFPKPLVASIQGVCVAGGLELALAADIRIAAFDATLGLPEVRWGIVPSGGGATKLCDQIGLAKGMDLILTGRLVTGTEADAIGLVSQACESENVWDVSLQRARTIAENSPSAVLATKRCALERRASAYARHEQSARGLVAQVRASGDPEEGKRAFLEGRKPSFGPARFG